MLSNLAGISSFKVQTGGTSLFGEIKKPPGVAGFDSGGGIGILAFVSAIINLLTIVAGIWVLFNFVLAGYQYITSSGDTSAHGKVRDRITMSVLGLIIIASAYTIMAVIGLLFFGNAAFFLNPTLSGPAGTGQ